MNRHYLAVGWVGLCMAALAVGTADAQRSGPAYPNVDKAIEIGPGDTIRLLIRYMNEGGPMVRGPGKRLDLVYATSIPKSDAAARMAQADKAAQIFGVDAVELGVAKLSVGICDTRACAERKDPPSVWYMYERTNRGWKRMP
jgi:hypothetical protein